MLFDRITPEEAGVKSSAIAKYINKLNSNNIAMHSIVMMKGDKIFSECYYAPYNKDSLNRMYSQTKSFVSVAIGLLLEEGKLRLDDKIIDYFPEKIDTPPSEFLKNQTIEQNLTMTTVGHPSIQWFNWNCYDRTHYYFNAKRNIPRPSGTIWEYDSAGSQVLSSLVEKLSGKSLFDYLNEKIFKHLGTFKSATILKTPNGDSWGDSALICTQRDILSFARFVMNYGVWKGKRLISEEYLKKATSKVVDNKDGSKLTAFRHGYGYQFWRCKNDGFAFVGMGNQLTLCLPNEDIIFSCTADCQGDNELGREYIVNSFFDLIIDNLSKSPLPKNDSEFKELTSIEQSQQLFYLKGKNDSPLRKKIDGKTFECESNDAGIEKFTFKFKNEKEGELHYKNAQGEKVLPFGINHNTFGKFPQYGYSNDFGGVGTNDGFMYNDAVSMAWIDDNKLIIYAQIIDKYLGNLTMYFAFNGEYATLNMTKHAEAFLDEYQGTLIAKINL